MRKGYWKQLSYEDKFDRKYACWAVNHNGWRKCKRENRKIARRRIKLLTVKELVLDQKIDIKGLSGSA